jgi:hypothetical protein
MEGKKLSETEQITTLSHRQKLTLWTMVNNTACDKGEGRSRGSGKYSAVLGIRLMTNCTKSTSDKLENALRNTSSASSGPEISC